MTYILKMSKLEGEAEPHRGPNPITPPAATPPRSA